MTAQRLILDHLLPIAHTGLTEHGIESSDADKYLGIIEQRALKGQTGSKWVIDNYRALSSKYNDIAAQKSLVKCSLEYQNDNVPVHEWRNLDSNIYNINPEEELVEEYMSKDIFAVHTNDSVELVKKILEWNNIHHLPVENEDNDLVGMITDGVIDRIDNLEEENLIFASQIMIVNPVTVQASDNLTKAKDIMTEHGISGLPVVYKRKLVGIITTRDFEK